MTTANLEIRLHRAIGRRSMGRGSNAVMGDHCSLPSVSQPRTLKGIANESVGCINRYFTRKECRERKRKSQYDPFLLRHLQCVSMMYACWKENTQPWWVSHPTRAMLLVDTQWSQKGGPGLRNAQDEWYAFRRGWRLATMCSDVCPHKEDGHSNDTGLQWWSGEYPVPPPTILLSQPLNSHASQCCQRVCHTEVPCSRAHKDLC